MDTSVTRQFRSATIKQLLLTNTMLLEQVVVFFVFAGLVTLRFTLFIAASFIHYTLTIVVQYRLNPWLLIKRLKLKREGSKFWDEVLMRATNLMMLVATPAVAGLDVGRFNWSNLSPYCIWLGLVFFVVSTVLLNWAMAVNRHFESTVRIQEEHKVIRNGPYKIVRHPGYLAAVFYSLIPPLVIGSFFSFIPAGIYVALIMLRTWLEDNTLQQELEGYKEYTKETRYRLFPGLW